MDSGPTMTQHRAERHETSNQEAAATPDGDAQKWQRARARLAAEVGAHSFQSWLSGLKLIAIDRGCAHMSVPSAFIRNWIVSHFEDHLRSAWTATCPSVTRIALTVGDTPIAVPEQTAAAPVEEEATANWAPSDAPQDQESGSAEVPKFVADAPPKQGGDMSDLASRLDPRLTFDRFVVGHPNRLAFVAARQIADSAQVRFNPLYVFSDVGLGITHLLQATAWEIGRKDPQRRAVYLSAEQFLYYFVRSIRENTTMAFKNRLRGVDVFLLDDLRFIADKDSTQEEFLYTFDALIEQGKQIVVAADCPPSELCGIDERIRSRLAQGLVADIRPMDFELRVEILRSKVEHVHHATGARLIVPDEVVHFLADHIVANVRLLEGALNRLVAHAILIGKPITLDMAKERLADLLRSKEVRITIDDIQRAVSSHFKVRQSDLLSRRRPREIVVPRQVAMYLCKQLTTRSLPEIGRKFGGRHHSTVIHAVRQMEKERRRDPVLARDLDELTRRLKAG